MSFFTAVHLDSHTAKAICPYQMV